MFGLNRSISSADGGGGTGRPRRRRGAHWGAMEGMGIGPYGTAGGGMTPSFPGGGMTPSNPGRLGRGGMTPSNPGRLGRGGMSPANPGRPGGMSPANPGFGAFGLGGGRRGRMGAREDGIGPIDPIDPVDPGGRRRGGGMTPSNPGMGGFGASPFEQGLSRVQDMFSQAGHDVDVPGWLLSAGQSVVDGQPFRGGFGFGGSGGQVDPGTLAYFTRPAMSPFGQGNFAGNANVYNPRARVRRGPDGF